MKLIFRIIDAFFWRGLILYYKLRGYPPKILTFNNFTNTAILRAFGAIVGKDSLILSPIVFYNLTKRYENLSIGNKCNISGNNFLDLSEKIILEDGVSLGPGVIIMTHNRYNFNAFLEERLAHTCGKAPVIIGKGSGIKAGALIVHGITIGENAVVGGNAVVNRDVPSKSFVAGVPAKIITEII